MQNRGSLFALDENARQPPRAAQAAVPHDHPGDGDEGRQAVVRFGVMGGDMQPQGHVQVLVNLIDFGMNVQAGRRGAAGRARRLGDADRQAAATPDGGTVQAERGHPGGGRRGAGPPRPHGRARATSTAAATRES